MSRAFRAVLFSVTFSGVFSGPSAALADGSLAGASVTVLSSPRANVTREDIERYMVENLPLDDAARQGVLNRPGIFREMAESLYLIRAVAAEAEASPDFDEAQAQWSAQVAYQRSLVETYRVKYIRNELRDVDWDSLAREDYDVNLDKYQRGEYISAAHILIKTEERTDEQARALASELRERVLAGEDFGDLAKEFSEDGSAGNGGNLGYFGRGRMAPEFEKAAFALTNSGDISGLVQTSFGFHIIRLNERKPAGPIPFAEVREGIIDALQTKIGNRLWQDKMVSLRSQSDIELNSQLLEAMRDKYVKRIEPGK